MAGGTVIGRNATTAGLTSTLAAGLVAAACALGLSSSANAGLSNHVLDDLGDFNSPVYADNAPGYPDLLFVVEQGGTIRVLDGGIEQEDPFLDISNRVSSGGELGLLSMAFHPNYEQNRRFYVFYINKDAGNDIEVDQYKRSDSDERVADKSTRRTVIVVQHNQADNHNGGQLQIDEAGDLYIATGDGGPQGDPENDAQSRKSLLGKILRVTPLPKGGYDVPPSNPFVGKKGKDEIYARGLRNPFRFSFDSGSDALTIGDVGGGAFEEIDYEADGGLGANFGWNDFEGFEETGFGSGQNAANPEDPLHAYAELPGPGEAVTGGYVIRDPGLPALNGLYLYTDYFSGELRTINPAVGAASDSSLGVNAGQFVSSFGEGAGAQIYVVGHSDGDVFALETAP